ncbi:MAG: hypothetical protein A3F84_23645 [Candidatus Handelsmanbacteria bacterium RIFCSPLOWO2_12_FULL_64_10]|uniref:FlgD/Vpr Ig-like domain-containing protein n=1 Tax=Handelsmanbacteria sp. (strain RIFCSPLOWO2_12_FULL_64_10) TaxID=1817868 RepID=A0A1F6D3A4_HANXR|nr:MAG: hypothetical protein A3F84_23645 [Candidatus Handelsmanbacteria bacterium RIFCSPLOWO2_12_FULL_64_10]
MPNLKRIIPAIALVTGLALAVAGQAFAGPNAAVTWTTTLDKTTGVAAGATVTLTFVGTGLNTCSGFTVEAIYDSNAVGEPAHAAAQPFLAPGKQAEVFTTIAGYNRRTFMGAAQLGGSTTAAGQTTLGTFAFVTKAGFTTTNIAVRQIIFNSGSARDTIVASPSPKVLQINPPAPAVDLSPAAATRNFTQTQLLTAKYSGAAGDTISWTATGTVSGGNIRITAIAGTAVGTLPTLPANLTTTATTFRTVTTAALAGTSTITLGVATGTGQMKATIIAAVGASRDTSTVTFDVPVPAELSAFAGALVDDKVQLNWTSVSQTNNAGWRVLRSTDNVNFELVSGIIPGAGTSNERLDYGYTDVNLPNGVDKVYYVLEQVDLDGKVTRSRVAEVLLGGRFADMPKEFSTAVYPNPFNPATTIAYNLPEAAKVSLVIYDAIGQEIRTLIGSAETAAGRYTIQWDAKDNSGRQVASGVYFAHITAGKFKDIRKMLLLK